MKTCDTCGNDIDDAAWRCPFCGSLVKGSPPGSGSPTRRIVTVNLKSDLPVVDEAMRRLRVELQAARSKGAKLVRVIHGYGSGGEGGKIKQAARRRLVQMERRGEIRRVVPGEDYGDAGKIGRALLKSYPALKSSIRTDSKNAGITFVEL